MLAAAGRGALPPGLLCLLTVPAGDGRPTGFDLFWANHFHEDGAGPCLSLVLDAGKVRAGRAHPAAVGLAASLGALLGASLGAY